METMSYLKNTLLAIFGSAVLMAPIISIAATVTFQQGVSGYTGTVDVELREDQPSTSFASGSSITVDLDDASGEIDDTNGLLIFNGIFGNGAGQIPSGSTVTSATLDLSIRSRGNNVEMLQMLTSWDQNSTWNSLGAGLQNDGSEATTLRTLNGQTSPLLSIDVLSEVSSWASGTDNYGWGFISTGEDGWDFYASEGIREALRPSLTVEYTSSDIPSPIPLPAAVWLFGSAVISFAGFNKFKKNS